MKIKAIHLKTGWDDEGFESKIEQKIEEMGKKGYEYYDIKITSNGNHCLMLFKKEE